MARTLHKRCMANILEFAFKEGNVYALDACDDCVDFAAKHFLDVVEEAAIDEVVAKG